MSDSIDRILACIDAGLQESDEASYGEFATAPAPNCIRCRADVTTGDFCDGCRAWMSGETDTDPAESSPPRPVVRDGVTADALAEFAAVCGLVVAPWQARPLETLAPAINRTSEPVWLSSTPQQASPVAESFHRARRLGMYADYVIIDEAHMWPTSISADDLPDLSRVDDDRTEPWRRQYMNQWTPPEHVDWPPL